MCKIKDYMNNKKIILLLLLLMMISCGKDKKCSSNSGDKLIQAYQSPPVKISLWYLNQGSFGSIVTLRICDSNDKLVESIDLRGEDYLPKIDSVVNKNIYLHYNFPRDSKKVIKESIDFESIVLGKALLNKNNLKYNYVFSNVSQ